MDPILTLGFCVLVLWSTVGILKSSIAILLEETPPGIEWQKVYRAISTVSNVHDVHVSKRLDCLGATNLPILNNA